MIPSSISLSRSARRVAARPLAMPGTHPAGNGGIPGGNRVTGTARGDRPPSTPAAAEPGFRASSFVMRSRMRLNTADAAASRPRAVGVPLDRTAPPIQHGLTRPLRPVRDRAVEAAFEHQRGRAVVIVKEQRFAKGESESRCGRARPGWTRAQCQGRCEPPTGPRGQRARDTARGEPTPARRSPESCSGRRSSGPRRAASMAGTSNWR